ncbi:MAG: hypothetical protein LLG13_13320 [Bacteroidales bacterium]|nr:hypothetical protein [Bacteroidales bacterium]
MPKPAAYDRYSLSPINWNPRIESEPRPVARIVLDKIMSQVKPVFLMTREGLPLAMTVFEAFCKYAMDNWSYGFPDPAKGLIGRNVNCEVLTVAFKDTWIWANRERRRLYPHIRSIEMEPMEVENRNFVTKGSFMLFAPRPNYGNVRHPRGNLTGKYLFVSHTVCRIGSHFFDPTFCVYYRYWNDFIERELDTENWRDKESVRVVRISTDKKYFYTRRAKECGPFTDSWNEIPVLEALKYHGEMPYPLWSKEEYIPNEAFGKLLPGYDKMPGWLKH